MESQISARAKQHAGITKSCRKRHLKELPIATREAIVRMYRDDHVFQCDIAKYFKISAGLVSKLVVEAHRDPQKIKVMKVKQAEGREVGQAV